MAPLAVSFVGVDISPMPNNVQHVFSKGAVLQIFDAVVGGIAVEMPNHRPLRRITQERCRDEPVNSDSFPAQVDVGVTVVVFWGTEGLTVLVPHDSLRRHPVVGMARNRPPLFVHSRPHPPHGE